MVQSKETPTAVMLREDGRWFIFDRPAEIITTHRIDEVAACLVRVEACVAGGWYAAGFLGYEAAPAFDDVLQAFPPDEVPLIWFGIFPQPETADKLPDCSETLPVPRWHPSVTSDEYLDAVGRVRSYIAAGDTYQVNYTYRLFADDFYADTWAYFRLVTARHPVPHAAYLTTGQYSLCSFSPELFFRLNNSALTVQPMKGTAGRGRFPQEDIAIREVLQQSAKERAENVMIVDMVRNDLGRIARSGSVRVPELCTVHQYHSVHQMISTVCAETDVSFAGILRSLFPCASITGAPKIRTSQIIRELETTPRHSYCGTVGWYGPGRQASFNIAIRTILVDNDTHRAEYGVGSGIVWDSEPQKEYAECSLKAAVVSFMEPEFSLIETLLWTRDEGYFLLKRHLDRLMASAAYFQYPVAIPVVMQELHLHAESLTGSRYRVRLTADRSGQLSVSSLELDPEDSCSATIIELRLHTVAIDNSDRFLYHKTTNRSQYTASSAKPCDDILYYNERFELTETTIGNIVLETGGKKFTPPVESGLLAGVFRAELLASGCIEERVLYIDDIGTADALYRINSVRCWQKCRITRRQGGKPAE